MASPIAVAVHGFSPTAALVGLLNLLVGGALVTWLKMRPKMSEISNARRKDELENLMERVAALEAKVEAQRTEIGSANAKAHNAEMRLVSTVAAVQLVTSELRRLDPDSPTIKQAMDLVASATTADFGFGASLTKLAAVKGVGE